MWAAGRYDLKLSEDEFWSLTLKEFNALHERHKNNEDWLNHRAALICTVMANLWRSKNTKAFTTDDFMPKTKKEQTPEQILSQVTLLNAAFGGNVSEN